MSACVLWHRAPDAAGYGRVLNEYAHRRIWRECFGEIPAGMIVHHDCEVKLCVNPEHLRLVTRADHLRLYHEPFAARHERDRARTACHAGHDYTPDNTYWHEGRRHCRRCRADWAMRKYHGGAVRALDVTDDGLALPVIEAGDDA